MMRRLLSLMIAGLLVSSCSSFPIGNSDPENSGYEMISVSELEALSKTETYTFINVHVPLEGNIPGTDGEIPFDEIEENPHLLPADKDEKIIIYCRSGGMGDIAAKTLVELGYTDVANLDGGYVAWSAAGLPFGE